MSNVSFYDNEIQSDSTFRTKSEENEPLVNESCFNQNPTAWSQKMNNFPKYARRQAITRLLALYELYKKIIPVKGSIIECGVHQGFGLMAYSKFSAILEPVNFTRRIYGFDTFSGFPNVSSDDQSSHSNKQTTGDLYANSHDELDTLLGAHDESRFIGHIKKTFMIKGDATKTIPNFVEQNPHLLVSLLFLDFDLYGPTMSALEHFYPLMPKGAVIAFDELDNPLWPGETKAMLEFFKDNKLKIQRVDFDPYIGFAEL